MSDGLFPENMIRGREYVLKAMLTTRLDRGDVEKPVRLSAGNKLKAEFVSYDGTRLCFRCPTVWSRKKRVGAATGVFWVGKSEVAVSEVFDPDAYARTRQKIMQMRSAKRSA